MKKYIKTMKCEANTKGTRKRRMKKKKLKLMREIGVVELENMQMMDLGSNEEKY